LPPDVRDWLPEGHLAWFVLVSMDAWGWSSSVASFAG
jgi:hypothetical protein